MVSTGYMRFFALLKYLVDVAVAVLLAILGLRMALKLFGADTGAALVRGTYRMSDVLLRPVRGVFNDEVLPSGGLFEYTTLLAIVLVAIAGFLIIQLLSALEAASALPDRHLSNTVNDYPGHIRRSTDEPTVLR